MDRTYSEDGLEHIPRIFFQLLVTQAQATVFLVDVEYLYFDRRTDLSYFARVLDLLGPREVGDMNQPFYAFFDFHKGSEVGEVANGSGMGAAHRVFHFNVFPWIGLQLFHAERHLAVFAVEGKNHCFYLFTHGHEILRAVEVLCPAHLRHVNQSLYARCDLNECTIIGDHHHFALDDVTHLKGFAQCIPWVRGELLQAEGDTFLLVVEVEDHHVDLVVQLHHFLGVLNASPGEVGDVYQAVYTAQVDEDTVGGDVLDHPFEYLSLLQLGDNLFLLLFEFFFDQGFVRYHHVLVFRVDLHNLEFHCLVYKDIIITDRLHVDLRSRKECFNTEYIHNHTTFGAAFDISLDDFVVFECCIHAIP